MDVTIKKEGTKTMVTLQGRLDTTNADLFQQDIAELMQDEHPNIEFDCTDMEYTSSQGLRLFLMLQKRVKKETIPLPAGIICNKYPIAEQIKKYNDKLLIAYFLNFCSILSPKLPLNFLNS